MRDRLDELTRWIRSAISRLIGNTPQDPDGRVGHTQASVGRTMQPESRPSAGRFRESVGQMTLNERLAAQADADRRHDQAKRNE
jgi:hypothetical protein